MLWLYGHKGGAMIRFFLCGDVMTGRGIDQVLPHPVDPLLHEPYMTSALGYVALAERANGSIPAPVDPAYIWGDSLRVLDAFGPDCRVINLETSITRSGDYWPDKGIHYRMAPDNIQCLTAAGIHCCALANNHVLDWGYAGLDETLQSLDRAGIGHAGAGWNLALARQPAVIDRGDGGRVLIFSMGTGSSGIPGSWAASSHGPGIHRPGDLSGTSAKEVAEQIRAHARAGDVILASIHWGDNWGYRIPPEQVAFAHRLIDDADVDIVHGHSSHHPRAIEVYRGKPVLYGCGDFINDYEGIGGHEQFRGDLSLMYFVDLAADGELSALRMVPLQRRRFRLHRAADADIDWLETVLDRESQHFNTAVRRSSGGELALSWSS